MSRARAAGSQHSDPHIPPSDADGSVASYPHLDPQLFESRKLLQDLPSSGTLRFLLASDSHLGYAESDSIRRDDSFASFEEALLVAQLHSVDFILLGGDLFHENKPSRPTLHRTMSLLRHYVLGSKPVSFQLLSDAARNFPLTGRVNYDDPNLNVSIPVFSIHGNHDDPAGIGQLSALDLLHEAGLINYFGKAERVDRIVNYPVLIAKGGGGGAAGGAALPVTKLALYGMGNVRDERLHRTFAAHEVKWVRPSDDSGDWFNVCVLHQNRVSHSLHEKNFISAKQLPDFLDMVVWGHEHECLMDEDSEEGEFVIVQPGSSVATSLSQGEARDKSDRSNKQSCRCFLGRSACLLRRSDRPLLSLPAGLRVRHVAIVEIHGDKFRLIKVPLYTVRPFLIEDVTLSEEVDPKAPNPAEAVEELLTARLEAMLSRIKADPKFANPDRPSLPLLRLRVEHSGFYRLNVSKFGQRFVGKVANPDELLSFYKQRAPASRLSRAGGKGGKLDLSGLEEGRRGADDAPPISAIVAQLIDRQPLSVLSEESLASAVEEYVEKKDKDSIADCVKRLLGETQRDVRGEKEVKERGERLSAEEVERLVKKRHDEQLEQERRKRGPRTKTEEEAADAVLDGVDVKALRKLGIHSKDSDTDEHEEKKKSRRGSKPAAGGGGAARGGRAAGRGSRGGRAASGRGRAKQERVSDDDDGWSADDFAQARPAAAAEEDDEATQEDAMPGGSSRSRPPQQLHDDFDDDDGEEEYMQKQSQPPPNKRRTAVKARNESKRGGRNDEDDEEEEEPEEREDDRAAEEEQEEEEEKGDASPVPAAKRGRVKAEAAPVGQRANRQGELNFLRLGGGGRAAAGGGAAGGRQPAAAAAAAASSSSGSRRAVRDGAGGGGRAGRGRAAAGGGRAGGSSMLVDLSEEVED